MVPLAPQDVAAAVSAVESAMRRAEQRAGRPDGATRLIAVSKTRSAEEIATVRAAGITDFGENYLGEALGKIDTLAGRDITWHFIGSIQSNKTRDIARSFHWVHTVDRPRIARRLDAAAERVLDICIQVNVDDEQQKAGTSVEEAQDLLALVAGLGNLRPRGLMVIPRNAGAEATRHSFRRLARLFAELAPAGGASWDTLSMGMSADYEAAIEEGATMVRVGTAVFGPRPARERTAVTGRASGA